MVNIPNETMRKLVKANAHRSETILEGKNFKVFKNYRIGNVTVNIISFRDKFFAAESIARKMRYIELNEYLLSISSKIGEEDNINFANARLYRIADGTEAEISLGASFSESYYAGRIIAIDEKLIAICDKAHPKFIAVVNNSLRFIPAFSAEQILRNMPLTIGQLNALIKMYPEGGWQIHNGIAINPDTYAVPTSLQFYFWSRSRTTKATIKANMDFGKLVSILTRTEKEKPVVKFVKSENF